MAKKRQQKDPEARPSGIQIETEVLTTVRTTDGLPVEQGDAILLKVKDETIICTFVGLSGGGYFVTQPFDKSGSEVKYRLGSISARFKVKRFELDNGTQQQEEAAAPAADPADLQTLKEA